MKEESCVRSKINRKVSGRRYLWSSSGVARQAGSLEGGALPHAARAPGRIFLEGLKSGWNLGGPD